MTKLTIIIPAFNERTTIGEVLQRVLEVPLGSIEKEIIVVDDASTDGTRELLTLLQKDVPIILLLQEKNQGKGAALLGRSGEHLKPSPQVKSQLPELAQANPTG